MAYIKTNLKSNRNKSKPRSRSNLKTSQSREEGHARKCASVVPRLKQPVIKTQLTRHTARVTGHTNTDQSFIQIQISLSYKYKYISFICKKFS